ncbi:hypothetical protein [Anabaena azotica]|uniref:Uncharacterized protein n=1 Tax=Anabaena azotica FACHB-119 TaxID=947527 RepID=A0ABR8D0M9_9NOST|nr:hypothetical protein [Anabaena azotica]MBD2500487.1 hypothetical protein [Anabaena azotica FACHB-119]
MPLEMSDRTPHIVKSDRLYGEISDRIFLHLQRVNIIVYTVKANGSER